MHFTFQNCGRVMCISKRGDLNIFTTKNVSMEDFIKARPMEEAMPTERYISHLSTRKCLSTDRDLEKTTTEQSSETK